MSRSALAACLVLVATLGCGVPVAVESDAGASHTRWRAWSWLQRPPVARGDAELAAVDDGIRTSFERAMGTRGFKKVDRQRPDFLVTYYAAVSAPIQPAAIAYAAGGPSTVGSTAGKGGVYQQGTIVIDLLDAGSGRLAWRGTGRGVIVAEQTPQERSERIGAAVEAIVAEFSAR
jgi:hypothetical protein